MAHGRYHPQPGDLIEIDRPFYQHWALYVGDGYVIHVTDDGGNTLSACSVSVSLKEAKVKKELLKEVVGNNKWRVNNKYDRSRTPRPVEEIIRHAEYWIDREVPYHLLGKNCEHFVTELRYGKGVSHQAKKGVAVGTVAAVGSFILDVIGSAAVGGAMFNPMIPAAAVGGAIIGAIGVAVVKHFA